MFGFLDIDMQNVDTDDDDVLLREPPRRGREATSAASSSTSSSPANNGFVAILLLKSLDVRNLYRLRLAGFEASREFNLAIPQYKLKIRESATQEPNLTETLVKIFDDVVARARDEFGQGADKVNLVFFRQSIRSASKFRIPRRHLRSCSAM